jgi:hypothetical protein
MLIVLALVGVCATPVAAQTPNRFVEVTHLAANAGRPLMEACRASKEACHAFTRLVACSLAKADANWGLLTKAPGENNVGGYAVDAIIYRATNQVVDIIGSNESPDARAGWIEVPRRETNHWAPPVGCSNPDTKPEPAPEPSPPPPPSGAATEHQQREQLAVLTAIAATLQEQVAMQKQQTQVLEQAIQELKAQVAAGVRIRF